MKKPVFRGVCTALVTPFRDGEIHWALLDALLQRQLEAGVSAVVLCGTTGEAPTLTDAEKLEIFRHGKEFTGESALILAGTGSNDTDHAVRLSQAARDCGVDGLLVVSPYYNKPTPAGLLAHYGAIADSVDLPIILYNVPSRTSVDIPVDVYRQLAERPNLAGVKEASPDLRKAAEILSACPEDFALWSGNDDLTLPLMALGGQGVISVASNVCPEDMVSMTDLALRGDYAGAAAIQRKLTPLLKLLFCEVNPIPVKAALKHLGLDCGGCRLPLTSLSPEHEKLLEDYFQ